MGTVENLGEQYHRFATGRMSATEEEQFREEQSPDRDYCPFCGELVKREGPDYIETCSIHGVLEGINDKEWREMAEEE